MLLILPHQLYDKKYIPKDIKDIIIWEHPHYFKKYKYNKKKLVLHRASMKYYYDYLNSKSNLIGTCEMMTKSPVVGGSLISRRPMRSTIHSYSSRTTGRSELLILVKNSIVSCLLFRMSGVSSMYFSRVL